jgi:enterochelin esterase-like enzyme
MDWSTQGALGNILDHLISTGEIQPMVVVMPDTQGFASDSYASFDADLLTAAIPYVEAHYRVSTSAAQRAIGGLGYGASITNSFLFDHPGHFGSYGVMSPGINGDFTLPDAASLSAAQVAAMKDANIMVGGGWQDPSHYYHASEVATLAAVGVPVTPDYVNGGHSWYAWRLLVRDFLTRVAFFPPAAG